MKRKFILVVGLMVMIGCNKHKGEGQTSSQRLLEGGSVEELITTSASTPSNQRVIHVTVINRGIAGAPQILRYIKGTVTAEHVRNGQKVVSSEIRTNNSSPRGVSVGLSMAGGYTDITGTFESYSPFSNEGPANPKGTCYAFIKNSASANVTFEITESAFKLTCKQVYGRAS